MAQSPPAWAATGFGTGTFVQTALGLRPIERLSAGEELEFRDGSRSKLLHLHSAHFTRKELRNTPELQPILVPPMALGAAAPRRPILMSRDIHLLAQGRMIQRFGAGDKILIPAGSMIGSKGIEPVIPDGGITYYHLLVEDHKLILAEGLVVDTMFLGHSTSPDKVVAMFDHLQGASHGAPVVPIAEPKQTQALLKKITNKDRALISDKVAQ